jgi:hypothetical protein
MSKGPGFPSPATPAKPEAGGALANAGEIRDGIHQPLRVAAWVSSAAIRALSGAMGVRQKAEGRRMKDEALDFPAQPG